MNCSTLRGIVRYGAIVLMAIHILALVTEGATTNLDYPIVRDYDIPKSRSKPRENRGFKPHSMSTAIGFGKRSSNSYQLPKLNRQHDELIVPLTDDQQRFTIEWFIQYLNMNPGLARKAEKNLFFNDENGKSSVTQLYRKIKKYDTYYYDE